MSDGGRRGDISRGGRSLEGRLFGRALRTTARYTEEVEAEDAGHQVDKSFLDQFNSLQKSGALDDLAVLRNENRVLDSLINDAAALYVLTSIEDIMAFTIDRVLQQFIPNHLLVIIEPLRGGDLRQYCYVNLKPSLQTLSTEAYAALKEHFVTSPYPVDYSSLVLDKSVAEGLSAFDPEIVVPLLGIEGAYGTALIGHKVLGDRYTDLERMYIDKLTRFISIAIQNNLHHESAITDAKTGLFNHAYFTQRLEQEIAHVKRHGAKAGIVMMDVDHFKNFNDTWGHLAGDEVLNALALTLRRTVRSEDVASRFGGEEFCALIIECDRMKLLDVAERIRIAISEMRIPYKAETLSVTASLGCCLIDPNLRVGADGYVEMADKALYLSKSGGRNKSTLYRSGLLDRASAIRSVSAPL
jgi:diguanylate cyclase (GGDEF)-like protein